MSISKVWPPQDKLTFDIKLDTCGLACPLPLLKIKQALLTLAPGQILWVIATQPSLELDIKTLLRLTKDTLLSHAFEPPTFHFLIMKREDLLRQH